MANQLSPPLSPALLFITIMSAQHETIKPKDGVAVCMGIEYFENDNLLTNGNGFGVKMMRIRCPSCVMKKAHEPRQWEIPVKHGYQNPWKHYESCVKDPELIRQTYVYGKQQIEAAQRRDRDGDDGGVSVPINQSTLGDTFLATAEVKSLHMWIRLITLKNLPLGDVECKITRESVKWPQVKSKKTVMDTAHRLVRIVEDKIGNMMAKSEKGQLIFDGYTAAGQHYVGLFASFMEPYTGRKDG